MDKSEDYGMPTNGKNTFLSRIFGLQSDDVSHSMQDEEMGSYPVPNERTFGNSINPKHSLIDEDPRVPESDQDSSSDDRDAMEYDNRSINGFPIRDNNELKDVPISSSMSNYNDTNDNRNFESIRKIGQLSSEEENDSNSVEDDDNDSIDEDRPLFSKSNNTKKVSNNIKIKLRSDDLMDPLLSKNNNQANNIEANIFTSNDRKSNRKDSSGLQHDPIRYKMRNKTSNMRRSFLVDDANKINTERTSKKPTIFPNISMLNKKALYRLDNLSPKERALWKWANVENLDVFLQDVYKYYLGNGFSCIFLQKLLNLLTLIFVVLVSTYMGYCIDYSKLPGGKRFSDITVQHCYSNHITGFVKLLLWIFYVFVFLKTTQLYFDYKKLKEIHKFYLFLLNISDDELQTIPWQSIIKQLVYLKDQNALTANVVEVKAKNRIDAHDVANRIMRKDNYLIAMYNNDIFDFSLPLLPFNTDVLTKTLEWNINLCVIGFAFNDAGFIKQSFLKESQRDYMIEELQKRFMLAGFLNILLAPFLVAYFVLLYFFRYFNEYKTSPGSIGARQYTPMAEWKFREYNELYHIFKKRIGLSAVLGNKYIEQFPKEKTNIIMKFTAFIAGSFAAILALLTVFDPDNFLNFEITKDRTVIFYITILGAIWSVCQSSISREYNVFDPEETIVELSNFTHYLPIEWKGKYHTEYVKQEFCELYSLRVLILLKELASMILTPFILWFSLPKSAAKIIDFFRESSIYIDGLGYVCKYAMFDVDKNSNQVALDKMNNSLLDNSSPNKSSHHIIADQDIVSENVKDDVAVNKMMQSYMYFIDDYENSQNLTGKYQLPNKKLDESVTNYYSSNKNYSWKKQFQPGHNPDLFTIGGSKKPQKREKLSRRVKNTNLQGDINGSFINSSYVTEKPDIFANNINTDNSTGVFNLVRDYYKQSDIGR